MTGIETLAWLMFGGMEDGAEILPEPLVDDDIAVGFERSES